MMKKGEELLKLLSSAIEAGVESLTFKMVSESDEDTKDIVFTCGALNAVVLEIHPLIVGVNLDFSYKVDKVGGAVRPTVEGFITFRSGGLNG